MIASRDHNPVLAERHALEESESADRLAAIGAPVNGWRGLFPVIQNDEERRQCGHSFQVVRPS